MKIPKRPGADKADEIERQKREDMEDYFDSLQDKGYEVVNSRLLTKVERMGMSYPLFKRGSRITIVVN